MTSPRNLLLAIAAAGAVALVAPGLAGAETICVHAPAAATCDATEPDLQAGLDTAESNPGADTVAVGNPGFPQMGPFVYPRKAVIVDPVTIKGVGGARPVLTAPVGEATLSLNKATIEGIDVVLPSSDDGIGIGAINSTLRDVRVTGPGPKQLGAIGIKAHGPLSLDNVSVSGTGEAGLFLDLGDYDVDATNLRTANSVEGVGVGDDARLALSHSRIGGRDFALADRGTATVTSTVLETTAPNALAVLAGDGKVSLDHVSVVHRGPVDGTDSAFEFHSVDFGGQADLSSVVISGYTRGFRRDTSENGAPYPITIRDSVWDPSHDVFVAVPNTGGVTETGNAHVDPKLVDLASGDYRLRGSSAAIDRDTRTDLRYTDVAGDGLVDGDGNGSKLADAGGLEYRRLAPSIDTTDVPASGATGQALAFSATASDPDGERVQFSWEFGDGAFGAGAQAGHTYAAPGLYTVTLHVTDEGGLSATHTSSVAVTAGAAATAGTTGSSAGAKDVVAPRLSKVRLTKNHRALLFTVSERATVRVTVGKKKVSKTVTAGRRSIVIANALKRVHSDRVALKIVAIDAAGNHSAKRTLRFSRS
jgi:PKD repeat protein